MNKEITQTKYDTIKRSLEDLTSSKKKGDLYFFIVSIDNYQQETNLRSSNKYANKFIDIFKEFHEVKTKNLYWLANENATKVNILENIDLLSKKIRHSDNLIIYFSGHGHTTELADFFVPFDGYKNNFNSCIPSNLLFQKFTESHSQCIFLNFDLKFSKQQFDSYRSTHDDLKLVRQKIMDEKENTLYAKYFKFFSRQLSERIQESFLVMKNDILDISFKKDTAVNRRHTLEKVQDPLSQHLNKRHNEFLKLVQKNNVQIVLSKLAFILENNDSKLLSTILTLSYKLTQFEELHASLQVTKNEYQANKKVISEITCEVIEKIKSRGFYLVKAPTIPDNKLLPYKERTKILFASANPIDTDPLRLDREARDIEYEFLKSKNRDEFELVKVAALRIEDLQFALLNHNPQFIHFSGHGNCDGIALVNNDDEATVVKSKPLSELFKLFSKDIHCIFLNSCHSINQSAEISKYIRKVICMNSSVPDAVAIHFAISFYKSLASGRDIDFSFEFAKNSMDLHNISGSDIPLLLSN